MKKLLFLKKKDLSQGSVISSLLLCCLKKEKIFKLRKFKRKKLMEYIVKAFNVVPAKLGKIGENQKVVHFAPGGPKFLFFR